ncbi:MAG TPA: HAD family hydrolase [Candidatus Limnocylindria bacterium]|nr:HAD family hydrolase [Candidatus Limnocylindria bacterium]
MTAPRAVVFDLGGTLVEWPDWEGGAPGKWAVAYEALAGRDGSRATCDEFVAAMRAAEKAHWERVDREHWSGPPTGLVSDGFRRLGANADEATLLAALDGYARAVAGWCTVFADTRDTLALLRRRGYRLGLLSNTWWAAEWHNADLAAHGLGDLLDELLYTSDLPHSKPHPSVFREIAARLDVDPTACAMIGDRQIDDVSGAKAVGMRAIWRRNDSGFPTSDVAPDAVVDTLAELPPLLRSWGGP